MESVIYTGETLWPSQLGHFFILFGFVSCLFAAACYYKSVSTAESNNHWGWLGRIGFGLHSLSIIGLIVLIFYMMINKMYEYQYVYDHVSDDLPMRYILSAFWEGQEGSFLLWLFWHIVLGCFIILTRNKWEAPVIAVLSIIQGFINSMLLGLYIPIGGNEIKIGSSPVLLLRDVFDAPIFSNADYVNLIKGTGLNPLLQNYWNTIHPPTLFLGFSAVAIPFCFAIAGLWLKKHKEWLKPALQWSLFAAFVLGTGILMGGAWAYEALSFGGYWAWDPVENTSLVPWIIMIAGIHTNLVALKTQYSIKSTYIFYILAFLLILYSTFLTRSGILGDTSVHAFTEMGLEKQLVSFIAFFILGPLVLYLYRVKGIQTPKKEEGITTREFWMFIGSIILFFSAALITVSTSLPVFNTIIRAVKDPDYVGMVIQDPIDHYNKYQLWIAVFIAVLSSSTIFLRYKMPSKLTWRAKWMQHIIISLLLSIILTTVSRNQLQSNAWQVSILLACGFYAILANLDYLVFFVRYNVKATGSVISHIGFGTLILGILISGLNSNFITTNPFAQRGLVPDENLGKNIQLIRGIPFFANKYWLEYEGDTIVNNLKKFIVKFTQVDENNRILDEFTVKPNAVYSNDFSKIAAWNPSTKHYLAKDIFTNISGYPRHLLDIEATRQLEDSLEYKEFALTISDTFSIQGIKAKLNKINFEPTHPDLDPKEFTLAIGAEMEFYNSELDSTFVVEPALALKEGLIYQFPITIDPLGIRVKLDEYYFNQVFTQEKELEYNTLTLKESDRVKWKNYSIYLAGFNRQPTSPNYSAQEGDIALSAQLEIKDSKNQIATLEPIYIIRNNQQFSIKDYDGTMGIHFRFNRIDPATEQMEFSIALDNRNVNEIPVLVADNVPRSDIIILEAKVFPGINLVWLGSFLMLFGLLLSLWFKFNGKSINERR